MVEADGDDNNKKVLKVLNFPVMDDDALPSSYIQRVLQAAAKWRVKLQQILDIRDELEEGGTPDSMHQFFDFDFRLHAVLTWSVCFTKSL